jgi:hypothetical protein
MLAGLGLLWADGSAGIVRGGEPDPKTYWNVADLRPGMKGTGRTVMVGTELEEFGVEVLGVLRDVSPGRDMILCRLKGCNLEHAGIIQGMSGSPIYVDNKLVGAVAFAWEFAKDPIAGVTPFAQMVEFVRANERRVAAEDRQGEGRERPNVAWGPELLDRDAPLPGVQPAGDGGVAAVTVGAGGLAGMRPIATPLAASGFSPRALALLDERLGPLGMTAAPGGKVPEDILAREGDKPLEPGSPVSIALVMGDMDLSGIGTVTHVEGDRVYAFGHPMLGLGRCSFPMLSGYIHTVYPRASVSMKLGSPLKVVGVLDSDVSTAVSGRLGRVPDMLPMEVRVRVGPYSEPKRYQVELVREPNLLATLVLSVLTSAIDTEGNLPEELTARIDATIRLAGFDPLIVQETLSGPRYTGPGGPAALLSSVANTVNLVARNPFGPVRIEGIECSVVLEPRRELAELETVRLVSDRVAPGESLRLIATLRPYRGERRSLTLELPIPEDFPEGTHELVVCDLSRSLQRRARSNPGITEPRSVEQLLAMLRERAAPTRTALYLHLARPGKGLAIAGQALPDLPGSARAILSSPKATADPPVRSDLTLAVETPWVIEGNQTIGFTVTRDPGLTAVRLAP